jgi:O-antigen/teichoic acid export membrane protein
MKNVAKISSGTVIGQAISILTLPVITRIYGAEIMGVWTIIVSMSNLMNTVTDLGLTQCIMITPDDKLEKNFAVLKWIARLLSVVGTLAVLLYCLLIAGYEPETTLLVSLFSFIYALTLQTCSVSYTYLNRQKNYSALMKNPMINYGTMAVCCISLGLLGFKKYGYYIGVTIGQLVMLAQMRRHLPSNKIKLTIADFKTVISENLTFVKYQMPTNIAYQAREQLPNLLIGGLFGNTVLGYFSISQKLLNIPVNFIGQALGRVFYQRLSELRLKGQSLAPFVQRNMLRAMKIAFIPMVALAAFGDAAIVMFFGAEYAIGGVVVRIVVFRSFLTFITSSNQGMDIVLERQHYSLITCLSQTVMLCISILVSFWLTENLYVCAIAMTICFMAVQTVYYCAIFRTLELPPLRFLKNILISTGGVLLLSVLARYSFIALTRLTGWGVFEYLAGFLVEI